MGKRGRGSVFDDKPNDQASMIEIARGRSKVSYLALLISFESSFSYKIIRQNKATSIRSAATSVGFYGSFTEPMKLVKYPKSPVSIGYYPYVNLSCKTQRW